MPHPFKASFNFSRSGEGCPLECAGLFDGERASLTVVRRTQGNSPCRVLMMFICPGRVEMVIREVGVAAVGHGRRSARGSRNRLPGAGRALRLAVGHGAGLRSVILPATADRPKEDHAGNSPYGLPPAWAPRGGFAGLTAAPRAGCAGTPGKPVYPGRNPAALCGLVGVVRRCCGLHVVLLCGPETSPIRA